MQQVTSSKPGHGSDYSEIFHNFIQPLAANIIYNIIYLLTAIGLSPGGSGYFTFKQT
jgi:hypothetical protein